MSRAYENPWMERTALLLGCIPLSDVHFSKIRRRESSYIKYIMDQSSLLDPVIVSSFARYIENVFEELDAAGEYFYNTTTEKLYFYHNGTGAPTDDVVFEAAVNQTIVSLKGTQADPVTATQFVGLTFKDSAYV